MILILKKIMNLAFFSTIFCMTLVVYSFYNEYTTIEKIGNVVIEKAEKNGGFTEESEKQFYDILEMYKMKGSIKDVTFYPGLDIKVQKRDELGFKGTYAGRYVIPFSDQVGTYEIPLDFFGFSHKFFK